MTAVNNEHTFDEQSAKSTIVEIVRSGENFKSADLIAHQILEAIKRGEIPGIQTK